LEIGFEFVAHLLPVFGVTENLDCLRQALTGLFEVDTPAAQAAYP
jgi:hypothetical protein